MRWIALCLLLAELTACTSAPPAVNRIPFAITVRGDEEHGCIGGMVVPVAYQGQVRFLAIDTGSALTFLYLGKKGPEYRPRVGQVQIGAETLWLPGRALDADDETQIGIIGVLGADYFCTVPTLFDPIEHTITRFHDKAAIPAFPTTAEVPFENIRNHIIVKLTVDGVAHRLMWDTGCPHLLLIGEAGRPGDERSMGQDVEGSQFPMYFGTANLVLGDAPPRATPTLRVPRFPYFEGTNQALGGNITGLAGQSVFGRRRLLFLPDAGVIRLTASLTPFAQTTPR